MDLILKGKAYELHAIAFLNENAPALCNSKNHGFYWAVHKLNLVKEDVVFDDVAKLQLKNYFDGKGYESGVGSNTHLPADEEEFFELCDFLTRAFHLKRPIQKAYCIRIVIKWAVLELMSKGEGEVDKGKKEVNNVRFAVASKVVDMLFRNSIADQEYINEIIELMKKRVI